MKKTKNFIGAAFVICASLSFAGCNAIGPNANGTNNAPSVKNGEDVPDTENNDNFAGNSPENSNTDVNDVQEDPTANGANNAPSIKNGEDVPDTENNDNFAGNSPENSNTDVNGGQEDPTSSLIENSTTQGSVVEFSDDSCMITPIEHSDDSNEAVIAAPGSEDHDKDITIHYQKECTFQIAELYVATGTKTFSDAGISDIKKQTSLIVYGEWTDDRNINATKVYIARYIQ